MCIEKIIYIQNNNKEERKIVYLHERSGQDITHSVLQTKEKQSLHLQEIQ